MNKVAAAQAALAEVQAEQARLFKPVYAPDPSLPLIRYFLKSL